MEDDTLHRWGPSRTESEQPRDAYRWRGRPPRIERAPGVPARAGRRSGPGDAAPRGGAQRSRKQGFSRRAREADGEDRYDSLERTRACAAPARRSGRRRAGRRADGFCRRPDTRTPWPGPPSIGPRPSLKCVVWRPRRSVVLPAVLPAECAPSRSFLLNSAQVCTVENPVNPVSIGFFVDSRTGFIPARAGMMSRQQPTARENAERCNPAHGGNQKRRWHSCLKREGKAQRRARGARGLATWSWRWKRCGTTSPTRSTGSSPPQSRS